MTQMGALQRMTAVMNAPIGELMRARKSAKLSTCNAMSAKALLMVVANHAGGEDGLCWASQSKLELETGGSESSIRRCQAWLEEMGILHVERRSVAPGHRKKQSSNVQRIDFARLAELTRTATNTGQSDGCSEAMDTGQIEGCSKPNTGQSDGEHRSDCTVNTGQSDGCSYKGKQQDREQDKNPTPQPPPSECADADGATVGGEGISSGGLEDSGSVVSAPTARIALIRARVSATKATELVEGWPELTVEHVVAYLRAAHERNGLRDRVGWLVRQIERREPVRLRPLVAAPAPPAPPSKSGKKGIGMPEDLRDWARSRRSCPPPPKPDTEPTTEPMTATA